VKNRIYQERTNGNRQKYSAIYCTGAAIVFMLALWLWTSATAAESTANSTGRVIKIVPGMRPVIDPNNLYSETEAGKLSPSVKGALPRVYVPNRQSNDVTVIDPATLKVVDHFPVGINPQHVVPSWDLKTLWVPTTLNIALSAV
jgi:YVTN family beta-propeller protein